MIKHLLELNRFHCHTDEEKVAANELRGSSSSGLGRPFATKRREEKKGSAPLEQNASSHFQIKPYRENIPRVSFVRRNCSNGVFTYLARNGKEERKVG